MRSLFAKLMFGLLFFALACGPQQSSEGTEGNEGEMQEEQAEAQEASQQQQMSKVPMKGENYEIKVVDSEPASPRKEMTGTIGDCTITVNYGSPKVKGRQVFGGLESYGEVWRTGANEQTTIEFSQAVTIGGTEIPAGTYGLFTIPGEDEWTVIINETTDMWGAMQYDESKDVARVTVAPQEADHAEEMEFMVDGNNLVLRWSKTAVPVPVEA